MERMLRNLNILEEKEYPRHRPRMCWLEESEEEVLQTQFSVSPCDITEGTPLTKDSKAALRNSTLSLISSDESVDYESFDVSAAAAVSQPTARTGPLLTDREDQEGLDSFPRPTPRLCWDEVSVVEIEKQSPRVGALATEKSSPTPVVAKSSSLSNSSDDWNTLVASSSEAVGSQSTGYNSSVGESNIRYPELDNSPRDPPPSQTERLDAPSRRWGMEDSSTGGSEADDETSQDSKGHCWGSVTSEHSRPMEIFMSCLLCRGNEVDGDDAKSTKDHEQPIPRLDLKQTSSPRDLEQPNSPRDLEKTSSPRYLEPTSSRRDLEKTSPQRHLETSPRGDLEKTSPQRHLETSPRGDLEKTSSPRYLELTSSLRDLETSPQRDLETSPQRNLETSSQRDLEKISSPRDLEKTSLQRDIEKNSTPQDLALLKKKQSRSSTCQRIWKGAKKLLCCGGMARQQHPDSSVIPH